MRIQYQKREIDTLREKVTDSTGFNWDKLGLLIVEGGLPKLRKQSRVPVNRVFSLVKPAESDEHFLPNSPKIKKLFVSPPVVDLHDHPRYMSLEYLRSLFLELADIHEEHELIELKMQITRLEQDLNLKPDMISPSGLYYRRLSVMNYKFKPHFHYDRSLGPPELAYKGNLEHAPITISTPYTVSGITDAGHISVNEQQYNKMLDPSYWAIMHSLITKGPSFVSPLRRFLINFSSDSLYKKRIESIERLVKSIRNHYRAVDLFHKDYFHRKELLITRFNSLSTELRSLHPLRLPFEAHPVNAIIYHAKGYWRSSALAKVNRKYILKPSKVVPLEYKFKIDHSTFLPVNKKKKLTVYHKTKSVTRDISQFNLISFIELADHKLENFLAYSKVPTKGFPYWNRHPRTRKRLRLRDIYEGKRIQIIRDKVFQALKERWLSGPIYVQYPTKSCLSGLALYFMNYSTRHHYRYRGDPQYTVREHYMFRLLITQGVIFEYWDENPNLLMPGQRVQLQLQNLNIAKELPRSICNELNLTVDLRGPEFVGTPIVEEGLSEPEPEIVAPSVLRGRFKFYYKLDCYEYKLRKFIKNVFYFIIDSIRRFFFEAATPFIAIAEFILLIIDKVEDLVDDSQYIQKFIIYYKTWDASSGIEDSSFDLNDYLTYNVHEDHFLELDTEDESPFAEPTPTHDFDDDEFIDFDDADGASHFYFGEFDITFGLINYIEDFKDDLADLFIVNIPYYFLLVVRPIVNFLVMYPVWSIADFLTLVHLYIKNDIIFWYDSFLASNRSVWLKRLVILCRWFVQSLAFVIFVTTALIKIDYNEIQILIVYTFDVPFHEFYYTTYVMFVVLAGLYLFGPKSFKMFIKDELGFSNLLFLATCTGSVQVQDYDISPKPFKFTKDLFIYSRTKGIFEEEERRDEMITGPKYGLYAENLRSRGHVAVPGQVLSPHYSYDELEFMVESQLWNEPAFSPVYPLAFLNSIQQKMYRMHLDNRALYPFETDQDQFGHEFPNELAYAEHLGSPLVQDDISRTDKSLKTPALWFNDRERYYHHRLYNGARLTMSPDIKDYETGAGKYAMHRDEVVHTDLLSEHKNFSTFRRPGESDPQVRRFNRAADPALFSSTNDD